MVVKLFNVCFQRFPVSHDLSRCVEMVTEPDENPQVEVSPEYVHWTCEGIWETAIREYQRGDQEGTVNISSTENPYLSTRISYSLLSW